MLKKEPGLPGKTLTRRSIETVARELAKLLKIDVQALCSPDRGLGDIESAHDSGVRIGSETWLPVKRCGGLFWQRHGDTRDRARATERSDASK